MGKKYKIIEVESGTDKVAGCLSSVLVGGLVLFVLIKIAGCMFF